MFKSIITKFFLVLLGVLILAVFIADLLIGDPIKNAQIERRKITLARDVHMHVNQFLEPRSFVFGSEQSSPESFTDFFDSIMTPDVFRIKIWDTDSRVIFSDDRSIIGKKFPDDKELVSSLGGNVEVVIQDATSPENAGEIGHGQFFEEYVPVYFGGNASPAGVVEIYSNLDEVYALISKIRTIISLAMFCAALGAFLIIWFLFQLLVRKRFNLLLEATNEIAEGNLKIRVAVKGDDEIGNLAVAFNSMAVKLEGSYADLEQKIEERTEQLNRENRLMVNRELKMVELKKEIEELKKKIG